jgi:hypothetical protein
MTLRGGLLTCIGVTAAAALLAATGADVPVLRELLAVAALLCAPGFALLAATRLYETSSTSERVVYTVAGSLALAVLSGVVVALLPFGLTAASASVAAFVVTTCAALVALRRGPGGDGGGAGTPRAQRLGRAVTAGQAGLFAAAALVAVAAFLVARDGARDHAERSQFAELWLVPPEPGEDALRVGVRNEGSRRTAYTLRVSSGENPGRTWRVSLAPGGQFTRSLPLEEVDPDSRIEARLLDAAGQEVRSVAVSPATVQSLAEESP